jgi:oligoendopeptidase F
VASFGMEMLALDYLDEFYEGDDLARAKRTQLEGIVTLFPWVATIDAFQHFLYTHPDHTREQRRTHWLELRERFGGIADYSGYEDALSFAWHRQLHLFEVPFYYIEYGIAKLGALQVWRNAAADRQEATHAYRRALALGGSQPLPDLFEAAGAKFDFSYDTVAPLVDMLMVELDKLPQ